MDHKDIGRDESQGRGQVDEEVEKLKKNACGGKSKTNERRRGLREEMG